MEEFLAKWELNEESQEAFQTLELEMQNDIMETFAPRDTSRDVNSLFMSFVRSRSRNKALPEAEHHTEFFEKWKLNTKSQQVLLSLPASTQEEIMTKFQPRDTENDCNPVFLSFVKNRAGGFSTNNQQPEPTFRFKRAIAIGAARTDGAPAEDVIPADPETVQAFCTKWDLNEEAVEFLESLDPQKQTDVMDHFEPRDTSRDVNRIFLSFVRSRTGAVPRLVQPKGAHQKIAIQSGVMSRAALKQKWNLNHTALADFDQLSQVAQQRVMTEFNPRDTSRDVNSCFVSFCKSRAALIFAETWNLSNEAIQVFNDLPADLQHEVLRGFTPRDTSRDVNNVFMSYVRSRQNSSTNVGQKTSRKRPLDKVSVFVEEWRLQPENVELLESLCAEDQAEVMTRFRPRDASRDCNAIFAKFVASTQKSK
eukprot:GEMP01041996.1.p1 GENE.GEMP01041996.1~~GEMP01041996.1.p1  ORF type:complete len:422 (+),score=95.28 GEMP01041996.1:54-1319(+)